MSNSMDYLEFVMTLETIAIMNDLRLIINRASVGCGIYFHFIDDYTGMRSKDIVWLNGREHPKSLFNRLNLLAKEFKEEKKEERLDD